MTLLYNLVLLVVDLVAIWLLRRRASIPFCLAIAVFVGLFDFGLAALLAVPYENRFGFCRLLAYAVFLHGTGLTVAVAVLWRRARPRLALAAVLTAVAIVLAAIDAFLVEPHWLEVTHYRLASPKIHRPLRIVLIADLQTDRIGPYEQAVLRRVLDEKPDLILFGGDYVQASGPREKELSQQLHDLLKEIGLSAPQGVFAVQGNVESSHWTDIFQGLPVETVSSDATFDLGDLRLTCLGIVHSENRRLKIPEAPAGRFHLVLGHSPNFALGDVKADLLLAGHTHGGQVRLPWLGPIITGSRVSRSQAAGLTELPQGGHLLVSRGVGMERGRAPRFRFLCRPELVVIDLVPEAS